MVMRSPRLPIAWPAARLGAMPTSAGVVLFRVREGAIEVLLGHMGGPFWARRDERAWSIPKGELDEGEDALAGARREFAEELGHAPPDGAVLDLGEIRQRGGKRVIAFGLEGDFDAAQLIAGTFEMQWPPQSGERQVFPELDRVAWFDLATAERKIVQGQVALLHRLAQELARDARLR
jgi:predicted NUDIX family NTP pyrophosphohydrolase